MTYVDVDTTSHDRVAVVTLNRPERLNALGATLVGEATAAFRSLSRERPVSAADERRTAILRAGILLGRRPQRRGGLRLRHAQRPRPGGRARRLTL